MRILSQDGMIDVPYEMVGINIWPKKDPKRDAFCVYAHSNSLNMKEGIMAKYSTEEKAKKAMEMLHGAYCGEIYLKCGDYEVENIDLAQEIQKKIEEEMRKPHFLEIKPSNPVVECKIFQFPADEEIEV